MENEFGKGEEEERQYSVPIAIRKEGAAMTTTTTTTIGDDGAASGDFDYDTYATASALLSSAISDLTPIENPSSSSSTSALLSSSSRTTFAESSNVTTDGDLAPATPTSTTSHAAATTITTPATATATATATTATATTATATTATAITATVITAPTTAENEKPKPKYRAPSPPRWRFVKVAKSTLGYSSNAAGITVHGKSAHELGAKYTPPIIHYEAKKEEREEVGELAIKGVGIMEFTKEREEEVGQLGDKELEYSKFKKELNVVGKLNIDETAVENEELYEGGVVIWHDASTASHEDQSRQWVNYAPRSKTFKDDGGDDKDRCTNLMETEDFGKRLQGEVGRLTFDPDDYLDETFEGAYPQRIEDEDEEDLRDEGTYPGSTVRLKLPATTPYTSNVEAQEPIGEGHIDNNTNNCPLRKSRLSRNILPVIAEEDVDDFASKSGTLESSTTLSSNPRNPKFKFLLMLLPLLLAGAITGVVLGGREEKEKKKGGDDGVSAIGGTGSAVVLDESESPSMSPSFEFGNSNLFFAAGGGEEDGMPSTMPSSNPSEYEYQGLFRPPAVTPSPESKNAVVDWPTSPAPTFLPTASSTKERSSEPSGTPSRVNSEVPSSGPTALPTNTPSTIPSAAPTNSPFTRPSASPSSDPSRTPSTSPSTSFPTTQPINFHGPCPKPFVPLSYYIPGIMVQFEGVVYECITYSCGTWGYELHSENELWKEAWEMVGSCMGTMVPTLGPSVVPSGMPSAMPSGNPSMMPTRRPTSSPNRAPSEIPTKSPSISPSKQPITVGPSKRPSIFPSKTPSKSPSNEPTTSPSKLPTTTPTPRPSKAPSNAPSSRPTSSPSKAPAKKSNLEPSGSPFIKLTNSPSDMPTREPTIKPSVSPSVRPMSSPSKEPTSDPSTMPTRSPSNQPTKEPSSEPSASPSKAPSRSPSNQPTDAPTTDPSASPSTRPTRYPSHQPTKDPTSQPSATPSTRPTSSPSGQPTKMPTAEPSTTPTLSPTRSPSTKPTPQPTQPFPTKKPTGSPTFQPTCAENGNFNLCIALDMSGSVCNGSGGGQCESCEPLNQCNSGGEKPSICCPNFSNMLEFAKDLTTALGELSTDQDFSLVHFGTEVSIASTLDSWRQAIKSINKLRYTGGMTNLAGAITSCQLTLDQSPSDRKNLMLILTDGAPSVPGSLQNARNVATAAAQDAIGKETFIIPVLIEEPNPFDSAVTYLRNNISSDGKVFLSDFEGLNDLQETLFEQVTCQTNTNDNKDTLWEQK